MGDMEQVTKFLTEARRRLAESRDIAEARLLKTTITGLEKHFTGGEITIDDTEAFMTVFFRRPRTGQRMQP
jgi:hypothetical protein